MSGSRGPAPERSRPRRDAQGCDDDRARASERRSGRGRRQLHAPAVRLDGAELCAVVKADGYGHGAVECARAALRAGATWLAVATVDEAPQLRDAGVEAPILIMGAPADRARSSGRSSCEPTSWCGASARSRSPPRPPRSPAARAGPRQARHRHGSPRHARSRARRAGRHCGGAAAPGVRAHRAHDPLRHGRHPRRRGLLRAAAHRVRALGGCGQARASGRRRACGQQRGGAARPRRAHFDMVRCGIAVYGLDPFGEDPFAHELRPALELSSYVADVKPCRGARAPATDGVHRRARHLSRRAPDRLWRRLGRRGCRATPMSSSKAAVGRWSVR